MAPHVLYYNSFCCFRTTFWGNNLLFCSALCNIITCGIKEASETRGVTFTLMDLSVIRPEEALPTFCRGARALHGVHSLRELARLAGVSPSVLSRTERGLIMPSLDILYKWSAGLTDGHPNPEDWTTAIYAATATWPEEAQFLLVRYSDPVHVPEICWDLSRQARALEVVMERHSCNSAPTVVHSVQNYQHIGSQRYPRFTSAMHSPAADAASLTAWFSIFRQADPSVYAAAARFLLDPDAPLLNTSVEEQSRVWVWLVESVWAPNGAKPMQRVRDTAETRASEDVLWQELQNLWPRLASPTQQALVTLAQQSQA